MNIKLGWKLSLDLVMFIIFVCLMATAIIPHQVHELLGVMLIGLLTFHNISNIRWYKNLAKGKYTLIRLLHTLVNLSLLTLILINIISALGISLWLFLFLPIDWGMTGRSIHVVSAYWGMILLAMHIGFHWEMLIKFTRKNCHLPFFTSHIAKIYPLFSLVIAIYGMYATYKLDIKERLIGQYGFSFFDPTQSTFLVLIDYLSCMGLFITMTHYGLKWLQSG